MDLTKFSSINSRYNDSSSHQNASSPNDTSRKKRSYSCPPCFPIEKIALRKSSSNDSEKLSLSSQVKKFSYSLGDEIDAMLDAEQKSQFDLKIIKAAFGSIFKNGIPSTQKDVSTTTDDISTKIETLKETLENQDTSTLTQSRPYSSSLRGRKTSRNPRAKLKPQKCSREKSVPGCRYKGTPQVYIEYLNIYVVQTNDISKSSHGNSSRNNDNDLKSDSESVHEEAQAATGHVEDEENEANGPLTVVPNASATSPQSPETSDRVPNSAANAGAKDTGNGASNSDASSRVDDSYGPQHLSQAAGAEACEPATIPKGSSVSGKSEIPEENEFAANPKLDSPEGIQIGSNEAADAEARQRIASPTHSDSEDDSVEQMLPDIPEVSGNGASASTSLAAANVSPLAATRANVAAPPRPTITNSGTSVAITTPDSSERFQARTTTASSVSAPSSHSSQAIIAQSIDSTGATAPSTSKRPDLEVRLPFEAANSAAGLSGPVSSTYADSLHCAPERPLPPSKPGMPEQNEGRPLKMCSNDPLSKSAPEGFPLDPPLEFADDPYAQLSLPAQLKNTSQNALPSGINCCYISCSRT